MPKNNLKHNYIVKQKDLDALIKKIKKHKVIAIDTEFTRRRTYYAILSIIQIAVQTSKNKKELFIIDCKSKDIDLSKFIKKVINSEKIIKIIHSCNQDIQIFYHQSKKLPKGIFDTQIMANFCGFDNNIGYSSLVKKIFDKDLDKQEQNSNWQKRPLSPEQINYALIDVIYLEEIYQTLLKEIKKRSFLKAYKEEIKKYAKETLTRDNSFLIKNFNLRGKNAKEVLRLRKFIDWREKKAQEKDVPRRHFLSDEDLANYANRNFSRVRLNRNFDKKSLVQAKKLSKKFILNYNIFSKKTKNISLNAREKKVCEKAKKIIAKIASKNRINPQFLITSPDLKKVVSSKKNFKKIISGWRYSLLGEELKKIIF